MLPQLAPDQSTHEIALPPGNHGIVVLDDSGAAMLWHDGSAPHVMRARILALGEMLLAATAEHREMRVEHEFADGMYLRKLHIPKGTILVGKIHLKSCLNIVASGEIDVLTEFGSRRLSAGFTGVSRAGIQKVGIAHEDTVFINVFRTDETDIGKVEAEIAVDPILMLRGRAEPDAASEIDLDSIRADYRLFLSEYGLTESQVQAIVDDMSDHIELPGEHGFRVAASRIHGVGTFASRQFAHGDVIATARVDGKRTPVGRRTNHSPDPNCRFDRNGLGDLLMIADRPIQAGCELTIDYRQAARINKELGLQPMKEAVCL